MRFPFRNDIVDLKMKRSTRWLFQDVSHWERWSYEPSAVLLIIHYTYFTCILTLGETAKLCCHWPHWSAHLGNPDLESLGPSAGSRWRLSHLPHSKKMKSQRSSIDIAGYSCSKITIK